MIVKRYSIISICENLNIFIFYNTTFYFYFFCILQLVIELSAITNEERDLLIYDDDKESEGEENNDENAKSTNTGPKKKIHSLKRKIKDLSKILQLQVTRKPVSKKIEATTPISLTNNILTITMLLSCFIIGATIQS